MTSKIELQATVKTLQALYSQEAELKEAIKNQEQVLKDYMEAQKI